MARDYQEALAPLQGLQVHPVGAAADMLSVTFGSLRTVTDRNGREKQLGEWALHVQCPWRFLQSDNLLLGSSDFYYVPGSVERYDFDAGGENVFHRSAKRLNEAIVAERICVLEVRCAEAGAFDIFFDQALKLSVMPTLSDPVCGEDWRFFAPRTGRRHFVFPNLTERPNKALEPTPTSVTSPAAQEPRQP